MDKNIYILGISGFYHDSAACLLKNDEIIAAVQEERFTRIKHDPSFPKNSIKYCLEYENIDLPDVDYIVFYEKPFLKFERILEIYSNFAPKSLFQFLEAIPLWMKDRIFMKNIIKKEIEGVLNQKFSTKTKILFCPHHLSHASSAFFPSPFEKSAILTIDGVGEWATATLGIGKGNKISFFKELKFPNSVGLLYSAFTYYTGFKVNSGEYKLMGLAPYGNPYSERTKRYIELIKEKLVEIKEDGSIRLNMDYFSYCTSFKMVNEKKWINLFGIPPRTPETEISQEYADMAFAIQNILEEIIIKMGKYLKEITGEKYLTIAGGVGLNCVANSKLFNEGLYEDIWVQPASTDAGGALGAAYAVYHIYLNKPRFCNGKDKMKGAFLGPCYTDEEIEKTLKRYKIIYEKENNFENLCYKTAKLIDEKNVIGWFQDRMEFGPRALGNRSILTDARDPEMQRRVNLKIKFREGFRPFAPSVLEEDINEYFNSNRPSPYMLFIAFIKSERRNSLPENYWDLPLKEKLYYIRSDIPAITHIDFSARLQTVNRETNYKFWKLLKTFKEITGYSVIINTSFNIRGEPIVCSPEDALKCFLKTEMDYLVIGDFIVDKSKQERIEEKIKIESLVLD